MKPLRVLQTTPRLLQRCNHSSSNRAKANIRLSPVYCSKGNFLKTESSQGLSPIRFSFRSKCNVAINLFSFFVSWKSERSVFPARWQQSQDFTKHRFFKSFAHCCPYSFCNRRGLQRCIRFVFVFQKANARYSFMQYENCNGSPCQFSNIPIRKMPDHTAKGTADKVLNILLMAAVLS